MPTLANGWANLGAWYGYQELIVQDPVSVDFLSFNYLLSTDSYVFVMLDRTSEVFSAIRLSSHPDYESAFITMNQDGRFLSVDPLTLKQLHTQGWHRTELWIDHDSHTVTVRIDDEEAAQLNVPLPREQRFGFRGSYNPVYVDFIETRDESGEVSFVEDFSYRDQYALQKKSLLFFSILVLSFFIMFVVFQWKKRLVVALGVQLLCVLNAVLALLVLVYYLHNHYLIGYPNPSSPLYPLTKYLELERQQIHSYWSSQDTAPTVRSFEEKGPVRVLFIGSSQTWGSGASSADKTFVQVAENLANSSSDQKEYTFINAGKSAAKSPELLELYKEIWLEFQPQIVVVNLSSNDNNAEIFEKNLHEFAKINAEKNIKTVFVLEANSPDFHPMALHLHPVMKNVAQEHDIPVIDLHTYLLGEKHTGMLWWDNVHLTDYGHKLAGCFLFDELRDVLDEVQLEGVKD